MSDAARARSTTASAGGVALAVLCAQQFNMSYDTVGMNVALSTIVEDLGTATHLHDRYVSLRHRIGDHGAEPQPGSAHLWLVVDRRPRLGLRPASPLNPRYPQLHRGGPNPGVRRHRRDGRVRSGDSPDRHWLLRELRNLAHPLRL